MFIICLCLNTSDKLSIKYSKYNFSAVYVQWWMNRICFHLLVGSTSSCGFRLEYKKLYEPSERIERAAVSSRRVSEPNLFAFPSWLDSFLWPLVRLEYEKAARAERSERVPRRVPEPNLFAFPSQFDPALSVSVWPWLF